MRAPPVGASARWKPWSRLLAQGTPVVLTLKLSSPAGGRSGQPTRQVFTEEGGTIGRAGGNSLVLTHNKVSARHALITCRNGIFYIQDTSRNGVSLNSPDNRLVRDKPYALEPGDRILIEPYEIDVSIDGGSELVGRRQPDALDLDDPFAQLPGSPLGSPGVLTPSGLRDGGEVDPLKFFDPLIGSAPVRKPDPGRPLLDDLLGAHYEPPDVVPAVTPAHADPVGIPDGYDPLAPDDSSAASPPPRRPRPPISPVAPRPRVKDAPAPEVPELRSSVPPLQASPEPARAPAPVEPRVAEPAPHHDEESAHDFAAMLAAAGLDNVAVTPELTRNFGQILRVVVSGLMDVLQSRQRIKEEFRMRQTIFRPADNNPLKFSANVDDALHNLLVKRNAAYLGPVEAFADAFEDLRNHQLAMLAGMRVAFEAMLAQFDPERLQEEFDRQLGKVSLPLMPAKLRYWDLFREKRRDMVKDPEAAFARLFGEEFTRAYEEQFRELKAERRSRTVDESRDARPPRE